MRYHLFEILKRIFGGKRPCALYLRRYLYVTELAQQEIKKCDGQKITDNVWTMWLQEEVPEICEMCISIIKKYYPQTVVITEKNIHEYADIPEYIWEKYRQGIIKPCHLSDYIRVYLLDKYGGMWIDATCLITDYVPDFIQKSEFFVMKNFEEKGFSNYFICAMQNNYLAKVMRIFFEEYWKKENKAIDYFFFHHYLLLISRIDTVAKSIWKNIPLGLNLNTKLMNRIVHNDYNEDIYKWLCKTSYLHKLTYKNLEKHDTNPNSLYRHLLSIVEVK